MIASEQQEDVCAQWRAEHVDLTQSPVIFLDETGTQTVMTRIYARAPRGERAIARVSRNHGHNVTCLAALAITGIAQSLVFEDALDGPLFAQWLKERLLPTLAPGTSIILDNLSVHRNAAARVAVEVAKCQLVFLPPYSPDFNPIELGFSKLKAWLRGVEARDFDSLVAAIGDGLNRISTADARAYFNHCGYRSPP